MTEATRQSTASRRAVLAGLAAAPVATLPGLAEGAPSPNPELVALFEEFEVRAIAYSVMEEDDDTSTVLFSHLDAAIREIVHFPVASLADVLVKLRLYARMDKLQVYARRGIDLIPHEPWSTELWDMREGDRQDWRERALLAIARDLHRLAGTV